MDNARRERGEFKVQNQNKEQGSKTAAGDVAFGSAK